MAAITFQMYLSLANLLTQARILLTLEIFVPKLIQTLVALVRDLLITPNVTCLLSQLFARLMESLNALQNQRHNLRL